MAYNQMHLQVTHTTVQQGMSVAGDEVCARLTVSCCSVVDEPQLQPGAAEHRQSDNGSREDMEVDAPAVSRPTEQQGSIQGSCGQGGMACSNGCGCHPYRSFLSGTLYA